LDGGGVVGKYKFGIGNWKFRRGRGGGVNNNINNFGVRTAWRLGWGVEHFRISEGKGRGVKMFMTSVGT